VCLLEYFGGIYLSCLYNASLVGLAVKTIAVFVDVQNIYYTTREAYGRKFDYLKLWQRISTEGEIVSATAYAIHRDDEKQLKFQNALNVPALTAASLIDSASAYNRIGEDLLL
jgi:hypothetical protein